MKNIFENSLPVGLVMSLYDFDIPADNSIEKSGPSCSGNFTIKTEPHDDVDMPEHVWLNGEISWRL